MGAFRNDGRTGDAEQRRISSRSRIFCVERRLLGVQCGILGASRCGYRAFAFHSMNAVAQFGVLAREFRVVPLDHLKASQDFLLRYGRCGCGNEK